MEIILNKDFPGLGFKNEIISVKNGYGRNYLIPKGFAKIANNSNKKILEENIKQTTHKIKKIKDDATKLAKKIGDLILDIPIKVGKENKIFGNITTKQISINLETKNIVIDKRNISINEKIDKLGVYTVDLTLHKEIKHQIKINLVEDKDSSQKKKSETKKKDIKPTTEKKK